MPKFNNMHFSKNYVCIGFALLNANILLSCLNVN